MAKAQLEMKQLEELLLQSLEVELGGVKIYEAAVACAQNEDLKEEWNKYLGQTRHHVEVLQKVCRTFGIDAEKQTPGRQVVGGLGKALLDAIQTAGKAGDPEAAQLVAAECVTLAETKDHMDWELIGECAGQLNGEHKKALKEAYEGIEDQEDEHLYHTRGWARELWMEALGMKAMLPPPEERRHVKTAIDAAKAQASRKTH